MKDKLILGGKEFSSRFILGSGKFSLEDTKAVVENGGAQMATLALRRANDGVEENILDYMPEGITLLPNTSGARNAEEAVRIARLARALGCGDCLREPLPSCHRGSAITHYSVVTLGGGYAAGIDQRNMNVNFSYNIEVSWFVNAIDEFYAGSIVEAFSAVSLAGGGVASK